MKYTSLLATPTTELTRVSARKGANTIVITTDLVLPCLGMCSFHSTFNMQLLKLGMVFTEIRILVFHNQVGFNLRAQSKIYKINAL